MATARQVRAPKEAEMVVLTAMFAATNMQPWKHCVEPALKA
jgi:hypothetical protein